MKFKVSNTLFILGIVLFLVGFLFNYSQVKKSVESSIEKARRMKSIGLKLPPMGDEAWD